MANIKGLVINNDELKVNNTDLILLDTFKVVGHLSNDMRPVYEIKTMIKFKNTIIIDVSNREDAIERPYFGYCWNAFAYINKYDNKEPQQTKINIIKYGNHDVYVNPEGSSNEIIFISYVPSENKIYIDWPGYDYGPQSSSFANRIATIDIQFCFLDSAENDYYHGIY